MSGRERVRRLLGTGTGVLVLAVCVLAVGAVGGYAVDRDDKQVVRACYRVNPDGTAAAYAPLRVIDGDETCKSNERPLVWNLKGPPGPAGPPATRRSRRSGRSRGRDRPGRPRRPQGPPGPSDDCNLERRIAEGRARLRDRTRLRSAAALQRRRIRAITAWPRRPPSRSGRRPRASPARATTTTYVASAAGTVVTAWLEFESNGDARAGAARQRRERARERLREHAAERQHRRSGVGHASTRAISVVNNAQGALHAHASDGYRGALMALYDLPPAELETHRCSASEPPGLDAFWERTLDGGPRAGDAAELRALPPGRLRRPGRRRRDVQRLRRPSDSRLVPASARPGPARCRAS